MPLILNGTTGISGVDGSAGTPSYQGTDTNTGIFYPAADTIAFAEGGAEVMRIDSSGNVGIGITPTVRLNVHNALSIGEIGRFSSAQGSGEIQLNLGFTTTNQLSMFYALETGDGGLSTNVGSANLIFRTASTERMRIISGGNVCIGTTTTPNQQAVIYRTSSTTSNGALLLDGNGSYAGVQFAVSGTLQGSISSDLAALYITHEDVITFNTGGSGNVGGTERMRITSGGDLLIGGTTSTGARLVLTSTTTCGISMGGSVTVNNGASRNVSCPSNAGLVLVSNDVTGSGALFYVSYLSATCVLLADPSNLYANSVTAGKISLTKSANSLTVTLTNNGGFNHNFTVAPVFAGQ